MDNSIKIKQIYLGHIATLFMGSLLYALFRSSSLKMFSWFEMLGFSNAINGIRNYSLPFANSLPNLVLYALPDGFWMFSYMSLMLYTWKNELKQENIFWIFILPVIAIISEIGQFTQTIPGTFDILDLLMYLSGTILPFIIYWKSVTNNLIKI